MAGEKASFFKHWDNLFQQSQPLGALAGLNLLNCLCVQFQMMRHPLKRNPPLIIAIAIALGLFIAAAGVFPWSILAQPNVRVWPRVPWCTLVGLLWLALFWTYLNGRGWPRSTAQNRKQLLRARLLHGPSATWACIAGATGLVTLVTLYFVAIQFVTLPPNAFRPRSVAAVSLGLILPIMMMNAIVAGVAEEAAYRGYMQGMLERRFRATVAVALVTIVFTGLHLLGGTKTLPLAIPVCATSIVLGALTAITQSIVPAMVVHVLADTVTLPFEWGLLGRLPVGRFQTSGIDMLFIAAFAVVILGSLATVAAFLRLHKIASRLDTLHLGGPASCPIAQPFSLVRRVSTDFEMRFSWTT
jgi:membrane protease YdiL (CAAX protease family)